MIPSPASNFLFLVAFLTISGPVIAHGGVVLEDDVCVINIGFLRAHFTLYQPSTHANEEFCESLPTASETLFTLDYLDDYLRRMPLEFRIIRDVKGFGEFTNWQDVSSIPDLDSVTVFHQPAQMAANGSLTLEYHFTEPGPYIGVVTAQHPKQSEPYRAVFFFRVGSDWGYWPLFAVILLGVQLLYWQSNGNLSRWLKALRSAHN